MSTALTAIVRHHEVSAAEEALGALQEAAAARQRADRAVERLRAAAARATAGAEDAVWKCRGARETVACVAFSPLHPQLATAGFDGCFRFYTCAD